MSEIWTIRRILKWMQAFFEDKGFESARLDAELLVADALKVARLSLYLNPDKPLSPEELTEIRGRVQRRAKSEPVAYITGERGFWTLDLKVDARVLVPRPETELLVERALVRLKHLQAPTVVDVGTGSGCVALSIKSERPDAMVTGVDVSPDALAVARENGATLEIDVNFVAGHLLTGVEGPLDLVVSNPPYIATEVVKTLMTDVVAYEPHLALDGGADGLDLVRPLVIQAKARLKPGGVLLMEIGYDQGPAVVALCRDAGFVKVQVWPDLARLDRVVEALAPEAES